MDKLGLRYVNNQKLTQEDWKIIDRTLISSHILDNYATMVRLGDNAGRERLYPTSNSGNNTSIQNYIIRRLIMIYIPDVLLTIFYACFGIILMLTANTVIDFFVPGKFSEEIKRGNCAVAWLSAGSFIGIGEILRSVIMSPAVTTADTSFVTWHCSKCCLCYSWYCTICNRLYVY